MHGAGVKQEKARMLGLGNMRRMPWGREDKETIDVWIWTDGWVDGWMGSEVAHGERHGAEGRSESNMMRG